MNSNTYETIQQEANKIWKSQRYALVHDFCNKPKLPAPFVIFNHAFNLLRAIVYFVYKQMHRNKKRSDHNRVVNYFIKKKMSPFGNKKILF